MSFLLGIDVGTRACKILLFDCAGSALAMTSYEYDVIKPKPTWAEQDPLLWWDAVTIGVQDIFKKSKVSNTDIVGIGVDSQREAIVAITQKGKSLGNSLIWLDRRTIAQAEKIQENLSNSEVIQITGVPIGYIFSAPKILWLMEHRSDYIKKAKKLLSPKDFIIYQLTGEYVTDFSMASRTMLLDISNRKWSSKIIECLNIDMDLLPPLMESSEIVGEVTDQASKQTGLRRGTPIIAGGGDRPCEALGAGVIERGQVNVGTGTGTTITTPLNSPKPDRSGRIACCCHVVKGKWEYEVGISTTGASLKWFKENFIFYDKTHNSTSLANIYENMEKEAYKAPLGSEGLYFYPYLSGAQAPYYNDHAKGVFIGITLKHTKSHFIRSILEGIAYQYPHTFSLLKQKKVRINTVKMVGRETMMDFWNQIKTNVVGLPLSIPIVKDSAALGSAILAGIGTGIYHDEKDAVGKTVRIDQTYMPDNKATKQYEKILNDYEVTYRSLDNIFQ